MTVRFRDDENAPGAVRDALQALEDEPVPTFDAGQSRARLERAIAAMGPAVDDGPSDPPGASPSSGPNAAPAPSTAIGAWGKVVIGLATLAAAAGAIALFGGPAEPIAVPAAPAVTIEVPAPPPVAPTLPVDPSEHATPVTETDTETETTEPGPADAVRPTELALIAEARNALRDDPGRALSRARLAATLYPRGVFSEERAAIETIALARLGRSGPARRLATRFLAAHPTSAHRSRVERIASDGIDPVP